MQMFIDIVKALLLLGALIIIFVAATVVGSILGPLLIGVFFVIAVVAILQEARENDDF